MSYHIRYNSSDNIVLDAIIHEQSDAKAVVLMLHGINSDKEEEGLYTKLSKVLLKEGLNVFRFDFRSHGFSTGKQKYVTISGETDDLIFTLEKIDEKWDLPIIVIAASFGAVSLLNSYKENLWKNIKGIILLNPVLDLQKTFLQSELLWPKQSFNEKAYKELESQGFFWLDNKLKIGKELMEEITYLKPYKNLSFIDVPILIIHGDKDQYVPYSLSKKYAANIQCCNFFTIEDADHGFEKENEQSEIFDIIRCWIINL